MRKVPRSVGLITLLGVSLAIVVCAKLAAAEEPCATFTWNVRHERALFGGKSQPVVAGQRLAASPTLTIDKLYQLKLSRQSVITFVAPTHRKAGSDGVYAGLVRLTVDTPGVHRISLDQPIWVDVLVNGAALPAKDFQGRPACNAPHKIVEFELPAGAPLILQFSGGQLPTAKVAVTRAPAAAAGP